MQVQEPDFLRALQSLAQPAEVQKSLFPNFSCAPDELALDFESALLAARQHGFHRWSQVQRDAVEALDNELARFSGPGHSEIWEEPESLMHPQWERFRALAVAALRTFNCPNELPAPTEAIYVGPPKI